MNYIKIKSTIFFMVLLMAIFSGCNNDEITKDKEKEPCICPPDFNTTDYEPAWSPDGKNIAFVHGDSLDGKTGLYLISPGDDKARLWHAGNTVQAPSWSPDGKWIVFSENTQIWKKHIEGDSLVQITTEGRNFFPCWSPDGKWIAYENTDCGSAIEPPKKNSCGILKVDSKFNKTMFIKGTLPYWYNGYLIYIGLHSEIYKFSINDSVITQLTFFTKSDSYQYNSYPKYSSSQNKIIFTSQLESEGLSHIWVMDADGNNAKRLTETQAYSCDWSPDGSKIVYTDTRSINGRLWIMNADGSAKQQLTFKSNF